MDRLSCQYIKKDGSICGKGCWYTSGCARYYKACPNKICLICNKLTYSHIRICRIHSRIYRHVWRRDKKTPLIKDLQEGKLSIAFLLQLERFSAKQLDYFPQYQRYKRRLNNDLDQRIIFLLYRIKEILKHFV